MSAQATQTSGGVPLTRARLNRVLTGLPVLVSYSNRSGTFHWFLAHCLDRRRAFHPYNRMSEAEFDALRAPDMERAAQVLAEAGYHVIVRPHPDPVDVARLPERMRDQLGEVTPVDQPWLVPDAPATK